MTPDPHEQTEFWRLATAALLEEVESGPSGLTSGEAASRLGRLLRHTGHGGSHAADPVAGYLGFVTPTSLFFLLLAAMVLAYLLAVEGVKQLFYGYFGGSGTASGP